jgi:hypothetical protein
LTLAVLIDAFSGRAQEGIGKQQVACELLEAASLVGLDAKQLQLKLGRGPSEIHRPIDRMGIAVFIHQSQDLLARFAGSENQGNLDTLAWAKTQGLAQAEDRVKDKTLAVAEFLKDPHRICERPSSSDESAPVGLELQGFLLGVFTRKAVRNINGGVVFPARAAVREERLMLRHCLGLDEQLIEGRMLPICVVRRHREFNVARIEATGATGPIDQSDPPNLNVIFWRDDGLGFGLNTVIGALEHGTAERKVSGIRLRHGRAQS